MASGYPEGDKPYAFVPLPSRVDCAFPAGHARLKKNLLSGVIDGELVALTPVHIGSGNIELTGNERVPLVKAHFRTATKVAIPGSSLKGIVRSITEAITYSCVHVQSFAARKPLKDLESCKVDDARPENTKLCPACRLFGAPGYHGQVRFRDASFLSGKIGAIFIPSLYTPRSYADIYYQDEERKQLKGRKFYLHGKPAKGNVPIEVCNTGSRFRLQVEFVNLSPAELGVLLTALGQGNKRFALKLGGAKPACCGSVEIEITGVDVYDTARDALELDYASIRSEVSGLIGAGQSLLIHHNVERLYELFTIQSGRSCPSENY